MFTAHNALMDHNGGVVFGINAYGPLQFVNHAKEASRGGDESDNVTQECSPYHNND